MCCLEDFNGKSIHKVVIWWHWDVQKSWRKPPFRRWTCRTCRFAWACPQGWLKKMSGTTLYLKEKDCKAKLATFLEPNHWSFQSLSLYLSIYRSISFSLSLSLSPILILILILILVLVLTPILMILILVFIFCLSIYLSIHPSISLSLSLAPPPISSAVSEGTLIQHLWNGFQHASWYVCVCIQSLGG